MHGRRYYKHIRDGLKAELIAQGIDPVEAHKQAVTLAHEQIDHATKACGIVGSLGDGRIMQWIYDHREAILAVIKFLASIIIPLLLKPPPTALASFEEDS